MNSYAYHYLYFLQSDQPLGRPGKVGEFGIGQGTVREVVVCLWYAVAVVIITK